MDVNSQLIKCITLAYRESQLPATNDNSITLIRTVIEGIKVADTGVSLSNESDITKELKALVIQLTENKTNIEIEKFDLLNRISLICADNEYVLRQAMLSIEQEIPEDALQKNVVAMRRDLADIIKERVLADILKRAYSDFNFGREKISNIKKFVTEIHGKLEPYLTLGEKEKDPGIIASLDASNENELIKVLDEIKELETEGGVLRTGWQAYNRMLQGGYRRGEFSVEGALQHNYKTGKGLTIFKQVCMYNTPKTLDPKKKPMIVRITTEDSMANNIRFLYENIHFNAHQVMPDITTMSSAEMARVVVDTLQSGGFAVRLIHVNPSDWTYRDLQSTILNLESEGYEIFACFIDYLSMFNKAGCDEGPSGTDILDLFRRVRNFFASRKIACITPHQLSVDAKMQIRDGKEDFLKGIVGGGFYKGSKQIDQEVDIEVFQHIVKYQGRAWLEIQRGKHRGRPVIPETHQHILYPYPVVGPIPDDINGQRIDVSDIHNTAKSPDERPFYDFGF